MKANQTCKVKAIYSEHAIARNQPLMVTCILANTQRQAEEWDSSMVNKRESFSFGLIRSCWVKKATTAK